MLVFCFVKQRELFQVFPGYQVIKASLKINMYKKNFFYGILDLIEYIFIESKQWLK